MAEDETRRRRRVGSPRSEAGDPRLLPDGPPVNDPDLDEDGRPKPPDPETLAKIRGIHLDD